MTQKTKFPTGPLYMTAGVSAAVEKDFDFALWCAQCYWRHASGDWGDLDPEDVQENELALVQGNRVLSAYQRGDAKIWVVTEANRECTTILFPDEY